MSGQAIDEVKISNRCGIQDLKETPRGQRKIEAVIALISKRSSVLFVCPILYAHVIIVSIYWFRSYDCTVAWYTLVCWVISGYVVVLTNPEVL